MDLVPGVTQNPLLERVPQLSSLLQVPLQPALEQNKTLLVAERHLVAGAARQTPDTVMTVHGPEQTFLENVLQ